MLFTNTIFKTITVKEMEPTGNFVRMKVPELKNNLQVGGISVANTINVVKNFWILISLGFLSVESRELAIEI